MQDMNSSGSNTNLAILSGSKVLVWKISSPIGENGTGKNQSEPLTFDPYPQYSDGVLISSLAWNHNQMVIATSSGISTSDLAHDNIVLLSSQNGHTLDSFQHDSEWNQKPQNTQNESHHGSAVRSINFGGKSRYLCIGDESGAVCLWDLKKKIRVRQFFHHRDDVGGAYANPSQQACLDPTDKYVLSLSPSAFYQYNLRDGQLVKKLKLPARNDGNDIDVAHFTVFSISDLEPNHCSIGTDDGNIYTHDISNPQESLQLLKMTEKHSGEVTGLAHSPLYPDILFSCGKDGTLLAHNKLKATSQKIYLHSDIHTSSIQSMSLHSNGVTCAIGCTSGDVFIYNLHLSTEGLITSTLLSSYAASEPIYSLFFAPPPRTKDKQKSSVKHENKNEASNGVPTQSITINSSADSIPSRPQSQIVNNPEIAQQKPTSPIGRAVVPPSKGSPHTTSNGAESKNKVRAASPFARRLAALTSLSKKNSKQQKATLSNAESTKKQQRTPLSPRKVPSSPTQKNNNRRRSFDLKQNAENWNVSSIALFVCPP